MSGTGAGEGDLSQFQARQKCMDMGGDLASIHTQDENAVLTNIVSTHDTGGLCIYQVVNFYDA